LCDAQRPRRSQGLECDVARVRKCDRALDPRHARRRSAQLRGSALRRNTRFSRRFFVHAYPRAWMRACIARTMRVAIRKRIAAIAVAQRKKFATGC
jgi:hypothetical protein